MEDKIPVHLVIIPDGNRRWAKEKGLEILKGIEKSAEFENITSLLDEASRLGIKYFSLWGFSTENWRRSGEEKTKDTYDCDIREGNDCCYPAKEDSDSGEKEIKCPAGEPHYKIINGKCVPSCGVAKGTCYKGESKCPSDESKVDVSDCQADGYGICCK